MHLIEPICFSLDNFTEELLALHDAALLKVKNYYDQVKPLLEALQRWEKYWALFQDFEVLLDFAVRLCFYEIATFCKIVHYLVHVI